MSSTTSAPSFDEDRFSRVLAAIGHQAMRRIGDAKVMVCGMGGLGLNVAKCLIMNGVGNVTLYDTKNIEWDDLSANYYATADDVGSNRALVVAEKLAERNPTTRLTVVSTGPVPPVKGYTVVVSTDGHIEQQMWLDARCRDEGVHFVGAQVRGLFCQMFVDFGDEFQVLDPNGEQPSSGLLEAVVLEDGLIRTIAPHKLSRGDTVRLSGVKGENLDSLNGSEFKVVKVTDQTSFLVEFPELAEASYAGEGEFVQVKKPVTMSFKPMSQIGATDKSIINLVDFERPAKLEAAFTALSQFVSVNDRLPRSWNKSDNERLCGLGESITGFDPVLGSLLASTCRGNLCPLNSAFGGVVAQEVLKGCTQKYTPVHQCMYYDAVDMLSGKEQEMAPEQFASTKTRYDGQICVFGKDFQKRLADQTYFVVGAGAIGCEELMNLAMMGVGSGEDGKIVVTDMDHIELSNLSRQFLFGNKNIGQPKSVAAAAAIREMNPEVTVVAHENRVGPDTEDVYNDEFYYSLDGVLLALDNLEARRYMDRQCVLYNRSMVDSGTTGPKGHVQVVLSGVTKTYNSTQDPPQEVIPVCTLRNFPNHPNHCVEWSRDHFGHLFNKAPTHAKNYLEDPDYISSLPDGERSGAVKNIQMVLGDCPVDFEDCVKKMYQLWHQQFRDKIASLLAKWPEDALTKEGARFWSGSKRCPVVREFDVDNPLDFEYLYAGANLLASVYGFEQVRDRTDVKEVIVAVAEVTTVDVKLEADISANKEEEEARLKAAAQSFDLEAAIKSLPTPASLTGLTLTPIEFEKDDPTNLHIEMVAAASNLRSSNYRLPVLTNHEVKVIAGKIIPAMITTTATVSGLVCAELYKLVQGHDTVEKFAESFINLALPSFVQSDPDEAKTYRIKDLEYTLWTKLEFDGDPTLGELIEYADEKWGLQLTNLSKGVISLYSNYGFIPPRQRRLVEKRKRMKISELYTSLLNKPITSSTLFLNVDLVDPEVEMDLGAVDTSPELAFCFHLNRGKVGTKTDKTEDTAETVVAVA